MMYYTVGEMAKRLGVAPSTLRYYDQEGLLPFVERSASGIRVFKESDYEWLQVIGCLKKTGMQLRDIKTFIEMAMQGDQTIEPRLALITKQKESGVSVIFVGEDLDVLVELCDRILVICAGKITGVLDGRNTSKEEIGLLMTKTEKYSENDEKEGDNDEN